MSVPSVSPADTIRRAQAEFRTEVDHLRALPDYDMASVSVDLLRLAADALDESVALLAVGERDKAEIARLTEERDAAVREAGIWQRDRNVQASAGERDRRQIARVVEAVETLKNGPLLGILETYRKEHPDDHLALSTVIAEVQEIAAVLAGEEDAGCN